MDLMFNELSEQPYVTNKAQATERINQLLRTFKTARDNKDFQVIRIASSINEIQLLENYSLYDYYCDFKRNSKTDSILSIFKRPYIEEDTNEEIEYCNNNFCLDKNGEKINAYGFAAAYIYNTACIGFPSEVFWQSINYYVIKIDPKNDQVIDQKIIYCLTTEDQINNLNFTNWFNESYNSEPQKSSLCPRQKIINLRDDHGKDILMRLSKRLINCEYVVEIINSLPFNSRCNKFIKEIYPNGTIEIVLNRTDAGYGLVVQTTGTNLAQTKKVAEIIEAKYS